jgi:hypothetical protein
MNDYTKGILTGASLILCFFMLVSAKSQSKNLGDITVNSIRVLDDGTGGMIRTYNADGKETSLIGSVDDGHGFLSIFNAKGTEIIGLGGGETGAVAITQDDGKLGVFLAAFDGVAHLSLLDNNGNESVFLATATPETGGGFMRTQNLNGKETVYLGTDATGAGHLRTFNKHEVETGYFGTNKYQDGMALLFDRYGDAGWGEEGKK